MLLSNADLLKCFGYMRFYKEKLIENIDLPITRREMMLMISKADASLRGKTLETDVSVTYNDYHTMNKSEIKYQLYFLGGKSEKFKI